MTDKMPGSARPKLDTSPIIIGDYQLRFEYHRDTMAPEVREPHTPGTQFSCAVAILGNIEFLRRTTLSNGKEYWASTYGEIAPSVPEELRKEFYLKLVGRFHDCTYMVYTVGVVNGGTAARQGMALEQYHGYYTYDFMNYLIENKVGAVVESPVCLNQYHSWEGPSLYQAWLWIPPRITDHGAVVKHTGGIHNLQEQTKHLEDSKMPKGKIPRFKDMLSPSLVNATRFKSAQAWWDGAMEAQGVAEATDEKVPKSKWINKSNAA